MTVMFQFYLWRSGQIMCSAIFLKGILFAKGQSNTPNKALWTSNIPTVLAAYKNSVSRKAEQCYHSHQPTIRVKNVSYGFYTYFCTWNCVNGKSLFTRNVYFCVNGNFKVVFMANAENGFRPNLCINVCVTIDSIQKFTLTQTQTLCVNKGFNVHAPGNTEQMWMNRLTSKAIRSVKVQYCICSWRY